MNLGKTTCVFLGTIIQIPFLVLIGFLSVARFLDIKKNAFNTSKSFATIDVK